MQIAFHIGAHCTDEDQLVKSLIKNAQIFTQEGVAVPGPSTYRKLLADVTVKLGERKATLETQDILLEKILDGTDPDRLVLSFDNFIGGPRRTFENGLLYPVAGEKTEKLHSIFPDHEVEFFLAVRDPASFVPAFFTKYPDLNKNQIMSQLNLEGLIWSDVVKDIRDSNPDSPITVWCNEDTPVIWAEVMREVAGLAPGAALEGELDIVMGLIQRRGRIRLRAFLDNRPPETEAGRRRAIAAYLEKYFVEDRVEDEIDLPGWTDALIDEISAGYDDDVADIAHMPGVTLIQP